MWPTRKEMAGPQLVAYQTRPLTKWADEGPLKSHGNDAYAPGADKNIFHFVHIFIYFFNNSSGTDTVVKSRNEMMG